MPHTYWKSIGAPRQSICDTCWGLYTGQSHPMMLRFVQINWPVLQIFSTIRPALAANCPTRSTSQFSTRALAPPQPITSTNASHRPMHPIDATALRSSTTYMYRSLTDSRIRSAPGAFMDPCSGQSHRLMLLVVRCDWLALWFCTIIRSARIASLSSIYFGTLATRVQALAPANCFGRRFALGDATVRYVLSMPRACESPHEILHSHMYSPTFISALKFARLRRVAP